MVSVYKKCEKTIDNEYGIQEITSINEINKPFLFCISSLDDDNSVFGIIKEGARAARVRTTDELSGGFKIDEMPVMFLGYKSNSEGHFENIVDDFLYPLLIKNDNYIKNARRMNFFLYCNAANEYLQIEKRLHEKLLSYGLKEEKIKDIISQISVVVVATNAKMNNTLSTTIIFKDACDREVYDRVSALGEKRMIQNGRMSTLVNLMNGVAYVFYGNSVHSLKNYLSDDNLVKPSLVACVSKLIENSIENENKEELVRISPRFITPIILRNNGEFADNKLLLTSLDDSLKYGNVTRYTEEENEELKQLEESLKHGL